MEVSIAYLITFNLSSHEHYFGKFFIIIISVFICLFVLYRPFSSDYARYETESRVKIKCLQFLPDHSKPNFVGSKFESLILFYVLSLNVSVRGRESGTTSKQSIKIE